MRYVLSDLRKEYKDLLSRIVVGSLFQNVAPTKDKENFP